MKEQTVALRNRTRRFAADVIRTVSPLAGSLAGRTTCSQLIDAATAVDSNYRATCRARSKKEFIAKLGTAIEESDECIGWLELMIEADLADAAALQALLREANELTAIFIASRKTAARNLEQEERRQQKGLPRQPRQARTDGSA